MLVIAKIVNRALKECPLLGTDRLTIDMDLTACHANGMPLDLCKLLDAPKADFGHDVYGIRKFLDRETGQLTGCFVPRCAMVIHK